MQQHAEAVDGRVSTPFCGGEQGGLERYVDDVDDHRALRQQRQVGIQFRLTAQRLGQLRYRKDAQGQVIGRDISILLQQGNETLARAKAQRLIQDEVMGGLLESLENHIGVLLQHFADLERYVILHILRSPYSQVSQRQFEPRGRGGCVECYFRCTARRC